MKSKVQSEVDFYNENGIDSIAEYQLTRFNQIWQDIQTNVQYYNNLVNRKQVPSIISNWEDFIQIPILDRSFAKENIGTLTNQSKSADTWVTTGGSTGTPLKYPSWKEEGPNYEPSLWYARGFYNISRADRLFRLWGHSHTLGSGLSKYKKMIAFKIGHPLIGFKRFSAYDLSEKRLKVAGDEILKFQPNYIIGYSKALRLLAESNAARSKEFHKLNLKAIIGAAEGFDKEEDKTFIGEVFGCPVGLEYASMETKLLAHTHPDGEYKVIWNKNLVECVDENGKPAKEGRILVTSLYPRAFPLIRYELGDIITGAKKNENSVYSFERIKGRDNDFLMLDEKTPIHSEGITHAIKFSRKVTAYQIRYNEDLKYTIYVKSNEKITDQDIIEIRKRLKMIDNRLEDLEIKQIEKLKQTIAGKTKWLMEE